MEHQPVTLDRITALAHWVEAIVRPLDRDAQTEIGRILMVVASEYAHDQAPAAAFVGTCDNGVVERRSVVGPRQNGVVERRAVVGSMTDIVASQAVRDRLEQSDAPVLSFFGLAQYGAEAPAGGSLALRNALDRMALMLSSSD